MKQLINPFDFAGDICEAMKKGVLLTTKVADKINTMTIGWGTIGIEWGRPIFIAFVRESRFTKEMLDNHAEFTVNIPHGDLDTRILGFCGTKSGRFMDKILEAGLTTEAPRTIAVPAIKELPLTLECKVLYRQKQDLAGIPEDIMNRYYPADPECEDSNMERDYHYAYYAEIVDAYLIKD